MSAPTPKPDYDAAAKLLAVRDRRGNRTGEWTGFDQAIDAACAPLLTHIEVQRQALAEIARLLTVRPFDAVRCNAAWQIANGMTEPRKDDDL